MTGVTGATVPRGVVGVFRIERSGEDPFFEASFGGVVDPVGAVGVEGAERPGETAWAHDGGAVLRICSLLFSWLPERAIERTRGSWLR